jgi:hypothetical protein
MIIEISIVCATALVVAALLFLHFKAEREAKVPPPQAPTIDPAVIEELRTEIKRVDSKITKASLTRVFQ